MNVKEKNINDYLHFGYVPEFGDISKISHILSLKKTRDLSTTKEVDLIEEGIEILNKTFDNLVDNNSGKKHLVPLSGGLDSRLIFCALAERIDPEEIQAVTYGTPYSHDYEIPKKVLGKYPGISFKRINCTKLDYSLSNLIIAAKDGGHWCSTPDMFINRTALKLGEDYFRWSGFLGGPVAGNNTDPNYNTISSYAESQKTSKKLRITSENYRPEASVVHSDKKLLDLTPYEVLSLYNLAAANGVQILFPNSAEVIAPFLDRNWNEFMLQLPKKYRSNMYLYKKIICRMFPEIMKIEIKNNAGLRINEKSPVKIFMNRAKLKLQLELSSNLKSVNFPPAAVNYLYYPEAIRKIPSLRNSVQEACENIQERGVAPWLKPKEIFHLHMTREKNYSEALLGLLGLEVNLLVEEMKVKEYRHDVGVET